jgi:selenocysteine lyase/cysteine desulfurase
VTGGPTEVDRVRTLREVLSATGAGLYLSSHIAGPIPAEAMTAVHESDDMELRVGRAGPDRAEDLSQREKEARAVAAASVKGSPERLILAHGAAEAARLVTLDMVARASDPGRQRILLQAHLDPRVATAISGVAEACGWQVESLAELPQIFSADSALVAFPHVDVDGRKTDIGRVAASARAAGARTLVDASLSIGTVPLDVSSSGPDILIADTFHWLLGPEGVALAWLSPELGDEAPERLRASIAPFGRGALLALARSVGWLLMYIELPWVIDRTQALSRDLYEALSAIDGVHLEASGEHGAVAAFRIEAWDAEQAAEELSRGVFAIIEADIGADLVRASVGAWNREDEIARFIERVAELAAHTPETLPRKPTLTVISGSEGLGG